MADLTVLVIAKEPIAGRVKTRLTPAFSAADAASLAAASLADTLETVAQAPAARRVLVLDGSPGDWVPEGFDVVAQSGGGLDARLGAAFGAVTGPALLIGMDTPQILADDLDVDFGPHQAVIGPCVDGGYWAVGMSDPNPSVFPGVPMSTAHTCQVQTRRLRQAGMRVSEMRLLRDVDTIADAHAVAAVAPNSRFARELSRIRGEHCWPRSTSVYERALAEGTALRMAVGDGRTIDLDVARWRAPADDADAGLLDRCRGATLDIGCGPGRLSVELTRRGAHSVGVDVSHFAVAMTRAAGARALRQSVFDPLPNEGDWDSVVLADGNVGIGADPCRLLGRLFGLLRPGGVLVLEAHPHEADDVLSVRLHDDADRASEPFWWAHVGPAAARAHAARVGFVHTESWSAGPRKFEAFARPRG